MIGSEEIMCRFGTTATSPVGTEDAHALLRNDFVRVALHIDRIMDDSREKSLALTELQAASMWAHKGLADSMSRTKG